MKLTLFLLACGICLRAQVNSGSAPGNRYGKLPLSFETNRGQADARVKFLARVSGYTLLVTSDEAVFAGRDGSVERMKLIGAKRNMRMEPLDKQPGISNYFIGNDPSKWSTNIPNYARVALRNVYPGIDLIFYGNQRQLEYDWMVAPGADPKQIRVTWEGRSQVTKNAGGDLVMSSSLVQRKPVIVQEGKRIDGGYVVRGKEVAFELAKYDIAKPLVIDPVLVYSATLGGGGSSIAVDTAGNAYVAGAASPTGSPILGGGGDFDVSVTKIDPTGTVLLYSTYLGGSGSDQGLGIAVDGAGNAYVTGFTGSSNFPTANPLQASNAGSTDAFVTKIGATGSTLMYSTYLGGSGGDQGNGIAVDNAGNAYVTGAAMANFPIANAIQRNLGGGEGYDVFVTKLNPAGSALVYSTYLGGNGADDGRGIAVDGSGNAYVTGSTSSADFPTAHSLQSFNLSSDAFVAKINASGSALVYSTYLGGSGQDFGQAIALDSAGNAYVTGITGSTDFPKANPIQGSFGNFFQGDAFVTKINTAGSSLVYSTDLGGNNDDRGLGIAVNGAGEAYVSGTTASADFPVVDSLQSTVDSIGDGFVTKFNALGSAMVYSTYLRNSLGQGIALDASGNAYVTGGHFVFSISELFSACSYSLSLGGIAFTAQGGSGAVTITTGPGCPWTSAYPPIDGVVLTSPASGVGSGSITFQVNPNSGVDQSASFTIAGQSFTIKQQGAFISGLNLIGSMPHIAAEENWTSIFTMVNNTLSSNQVRFSLFGSNIDASGSGNPLQLPLNLPQQTNLGVLLGSSLDNTLSPNATWIASTAGKGITPVQTGSAQVSATGALGGFAIFHRYSDAQEAVVPLTLATPNPPSYLLAFDNTTGIVTSVAVANMSSQTADIRYVIRDDTSVQIGSGTLATLPGNGQIAFVLPDSATGFPVTIGKRGTVEFDTPGGGQIGVLGIRNTPQATAQGTVTTLTTVPALSNVGTGGGSFAFIAAGGDGWQTTFVLVNTGGSTPATLKFFDPNGNPLPLPISYPQVGDAITTVSSISPTLAAGATLVVQSIGTSTLATGSAQLTTTGNVSGFVIFRHNGQEAVVPIESRNANAYVLAFDNTAGTATGLAVNAVSTQQMNIPVVVRDESGNQLATDNLPLAANGDFAGNPGQPSPTLGRVLLPATANIRGTVEFDVPAGVHIGVMGIRTPATQTYTSLPALAKLPSQ